jgi:hypothetical protein
MQVSMALRGSCLTSERSAVRSGPPPPLVVADAICAKLDELLRIDLHVWIASSSVRRVGSTTSIGESP